jgi:teichuronic acid biosynthesis glycosyltransferase TuaG
MKNTPYVSVIMPVYNSQQFLQESIYSVINQGYRDWELIIVDDCSRDESPGIVRSLMLVDGRIRYQRMPKNSGPAMARKTGIAMARGSYLAFLDSDDLWHHDKLEKQLACMEQKNLTFSFTAYWRMHEDGKRFGRPVTVPEKVTYRGLLKGNVVGCSTVMVRTELMRASGMPDQPYEDFATWLNILRQGGSGHGLKQMLAEYRVRPGSLSSNRLKSLAWTWKIYRGQQGLWLGQQLFCFFSHLFGAVIKHSINAL